MQTAAKQKNKKYNVNRIRSGAVALSAALLSGCGAASDGQAVRQQAALSGGASQDGQMPELQIAEQQENGEASTAGTEGDSIKKYGVLEPLIVTKKGDYYEIIAGERRWRAARMAGIKEVPVVIRDYTDKEIMEISLIENIQREDLNPIEEAEAYEALISEYNLKQEEVAERVSKSRSTITNSLRLLKLCEDVRQMVMYNMISTGHARALIPIEDPKLQYETAAIVYDQKLSVRETEAYVKAILEKKPEKEEKQKPQKDLSVFYSDIENKLKSILGAKIAIKASNNDKGKIEINYYSQDELDRITEMLYSINKEMM